MSLKQSYMDRALRSRDPRFADILSRLGYGTRDMRRRDERPVEDIATLRDQYRHVFGKRPFMGWDAAELRRRIAEGARD